MTVNDQTAGEQHGLPADVLALRRKYWRCFARHRLLMLAGVLAFLAAVFLPAYAVTGGDGRTMVWSGLACLFLGWPFYLSNGLLLLAPVASRALRRARRDGVQIAVAVVYSASAIAVVTFAATHWRLGSWAMPFWAVGHVLVAAAFWVPLVPWLRALEALRRRDSGDGGAG